MPIVMSCPNSSPDHIHTEIEVSIADQPHTPPTTATDPIAEPSTDTLPTPPPTETFGGSFSCEPITDIKVCVNIGYPNASFPNLRNQQTQAEANAELNSFIPLIETGCSNAIVHLLCAVYAPFCSPAFSNSRILPCRNLCNYVRDSCEDELRSVGLSWPSHLDCNQFPIRDEDPTCFGPEDPTLLQIPMIDGVLVAPTLPGNHVYTEPSCVCSNKDNVHMA